MSDYKALFKHSRNYFLATIASKALAFISIPVYTRILSVEDYGVVNIFMSLVSIVSVFLTLSSEVSIGRYYYDAKDIEDFKRFVGTSVRLTTMIIIIMTLIFLLSLNIISEIISLPKRLTLCLIPVALFNVTNSVFTQIYNPMMCSKKIAIVSSVQTYTAFGLSVICILLINTDKYYGYVYGNILAMIILGWYMVNQIKPYYTKCFNKQYIPYILKYCLPYIPDTLSGIALAHFSKIYIGNSQGFTMAGSYGFVVNVATLMGLVIHITTNAWVPYFFRYMNDKDYISIRKDLNLIWRLTLIAAIALSFFGKELAMLLAKHDFLDMIGLLPLLVGGYVFHQWAYFYLRNVGYSKRMMWNTYSYMISGSSLVIMNMIFTPLYQGTGAAVATLLSYVVLFVFSYMVNRCVIKLYAPPLVESIRPFLIYVLFVIIAMFFYELNIEWYYLFGAKILIFLLFIIILLYRYANSLRPYLKKMI